MLKRLIVTSLILTIFFAASAFMIAVGQRRSFPVGIGTIVFGLNYPNPNRGGFQTKFDVDVLMPTDLLFGERFDTLLDTDSAFPKGLIDYLDCSPSGESLIVSADYLYHLDIGSKSLRQLTSDPHRVLALAWSPDGKRVAFSDAYGRERAIFTADADGSNLAALSYSSVFAGALAWSPDGKQIAVNLVLSMGGPDQYGIAIMDVETGVSHSIYKAERNLGQLSWSPDGKRIAFQMWKRGRFDLYTIQPDGANLTRLTDHNQQNVDPRWSPDGSLISYSSLDASGHYQLYVMNSDGSDAHLVFAVPPGQDAYNLCWLPAQDQTQKENS